MHRPSVSWTDCRNVVCNFGLDCGWLYNIGYPAPRMMANSGIVGVLRAVTWREKTFFQIELISDEFSLLNDYSSWLCGNHWIIHRQLLRKGRLLRRFLKVFRALDCKWIVYNSLFDCRLYAIIVSKRMSLCVYDSIMLFIIIVLRVIVNLTYIFIIRQTIKTLFLSLWFIICITCINCFTVELNPLLFADVESSGKSWAHRSI